MESLEISHLLQELQNVHFASGTIYQNVERRKALMESDELINIYHLTESHVPGLRCKAIYRHEKSVQSESNNSGINKENIGFNCKKFDIRENIAQMLQKVKEMPKEWVLIQLTSEHNPLETLETSDKIQYTKSLYVTVFHCGRNQPKPFCVMVDAPIDRISGKTIQIREEMESIIADNKQSFLNVKNKKSDCFNAYIDKHMYSKVRYTINNRLKNLVKDMQDIWLKEWRCLLAGKFVDADENILSEKVEKLLSNFQINCVSQKIQCILKCIIKSSDYLKMTEMKQIVRYCFPNDRNLHINLSKSIYEMAHQANYSGYKRHPIILVVDEKLDALPWEMLDILQDHPVSRMPSLHFTYALFKEHEDTIENGVKIGIDYEKGKYIINPGLDLKRMEVRLQSFFKYWTPHWEGLIGAAPTCEQFEELLLVSDIFSYNGHGNGSQFLSSDKIQKLRINSVVLLFGCGSVKYTSLGPQVEMYGSHQMYLIACSPCVVGMLWEVTDFDTDTLSTEFWSTWLPKKSALHWKYIDKKKWENAGEIEAMSNAGKIKLSEPNEPELLRALCKAKKGTRQYLTQASCVARGIPVKIKCV